MKMAIETFVGVVVIAFMCLICSQFISMQLQTSTARDYHAAVIQKIENSNFDNSVIEELKTRASEDGYTLTVDTNPEGESWNRKVCVTLNYEARLDILGIKESGKLVGYAR